jgi:acetylornithine/N-succinyldiaminopimelate aminotransferase
MNFGIEPDVVTTAKGLGGGLPIGAVLIGSKCADVLGYGDHGSTYGGNPVCCAGALNIIGRIDDALLADVRRKGEWLRRRFEGAPGVEAVTGLGLMVGLKTVRPAADVVAKCVENGALCLTAKDKVRLLPALNIPDELLERAADVIASACAG